MPEGDVKDRSADFIRTHENKEKLVEFFCASDIGVPGTAVASGRKPPENRR